ncbi:MAG: fliS [Ilumatobacteraceae bacterium]|nr:fliS [Ilumatobacteraceae bacterium]
MTAAASLASYAQASTATAGPGEIVRMAYERILTACNRAEQAEARTPANWVQVFHDETMRAQAILLELTVGLALDHEDPAVVDLARHLDDLYRYCIDELVDANIYKDPEPLDDVRLVIEGLHDAWVRRPR